MSNRRALKKSIGLVCDELFCECVAASLYGTNLGNADALLYSIIKLESDAISRISHVEPGMPAKQYFRVLREDFVAHASEIIDQLSHNH